MRRCPAMGHDTNANSSRGRRRRARAPRAGADGRGDPRPACPRAHPDVLATLEAAILQEPVSRGEVADAVDAAFALVARISLRGLVEDTPERHPQGCRAAESHIKTVARHLAPMIKGTGGRADASGFTQLSKKAPPTARRKCHVLDEIKNCAHGPQKRTFPDATRPERCIGWWVIIGRILNQPPDG